jgi:hypothetical protein
MREIFLDTDFVHLYDKGMKWEKPKLIMLNSGQVAQGGCSSGPGGTAGDPGQGQCTTGIIANGTCDSGSSK